MRTSANRARDNFVLSTNVHYTKISVTVTITDVYR